DLLALNRRGRAQEAVKLHTGRSPKDNREPARLKQRRPVCAPERRAGSELTSHPEEDVHNPESEQGPGPARHKTPIGKAREEKRDARIVEDRRDSAGNV